MEHNKGQRAIIRPITNRLVLIKFHIDDTIEKLNVLKMDQVVTELQKISLRIDELKIQVRDELSEKIKSEK